MKVLTIVIPSYNTEKYIEECLPTIIDCKFLDDIEILLINDGSTDNTLELARKYSKKYPNSVRVIDKENGGHGSVINRGIQEASGKYFKVIDGDDWVDTEQFNRLVSELKNIDADLILNSYIMHNVVTGKEEESGKANLLSGKKQKIVNVVQELPLLALHGITYRTDVLKDNHIVFQEKCFYEDAEYYIYPVQYITDMVYLDFPVYIYRIGSPTQSVNPKNAVRNKEMLKRIIDNLIYKYLHLPEKIEQEKKDYMQKQICAVIKNMYGLYLKMPVSKKTYEELKEFDYDLMRKSDELYDGCSSLAVRLLRLKVYYIYKIGYIMFKLVRKIRGF